MYKNIKRQMYIESYQIIDNQNINNLSEHYLVNKNDHMELSSQIIKIKNVGNHLMLVWTQEKRIKLHIFTFHIVQKMKHEYVRNLANLCSDNEPMICTP